MKTTDLIAIAAITHKPGKDVVTVRPGASFSPASDAEREYLLKSKAARALTTAEAEKATPVETPAKGKAAAKKADPKPEPAPAEEAITLDANPGDTDAESADSSDMLD